MDSSAIFKSIEIKHDYTIVGAGLAGIVSANILANKGKKILILEKRNHIGGNCYDYYQNGILMHKYGPHIFHTNNEYVWNYLSQFTEWNNYKHKVKSCIYEDGELYDFPINLFTINKIVPDNITKLVDKYIDRIDVSIFELINGNRFTNLGWDLYKLFYKNYSKKQWGNYYYNLDISVLDRVKIKLSFDDNYFNDKYQGLPLNGYTEMFLKMINNKNIIIVLNYNDNIINYNYGNIIYTGRIDELFDYCFGILPYRSLDFKFDFYNKENYQDYAVINYPNKEELFTRITEFKHMTRQEAYGTIISREYPKECEKNDIPYYPILTNKNIELYNRYKQLADKIPNLLLLGRLAEYKYYNMDEIINRVLLEVSKIE